MTYKRRNHAFNARLVSLAERIKTEAADDSWAPKIRSIYKIARLAQDYRTVYCDAVKRVMEGERK